MLLYLFIPISIKFWPNIWLDVGEELPWAAKGCEASVWLSGLPCMKGHLISADPRACRILRHKDKRRRVGTRSSGLLEAQTKMATFDCVVRWGSYFLTSEIKDVLRQCRAVVCRVIKVSWCWDRNSTVLVVLLLQVPVRMWNVIRGSFFFFPNREFLHLYHSKAHVHWHI